MLPVVTELARAGVAVSIGTTRVRGAEAAIAVGAVLVSGGLADPAMATVVADAGVPWVLTHWRDHSRQMYAAAHYDDVVADVRRELLTRVEAALAVGVAREQLVLDPGLGFAKYPPHDLALLSRLSTIKYPIDEINRPCGSEDARLRIPPNTDEVAALFTSGGGDLATCRKFGPTARNYVAAKLMAEVGLRVWVDKLTPHVLQHFCASELYLNGLDLISIQEVLGHSWTATTMRYIHVHRTRVEDAWVAGHERAARQLEGLVR
ncbi:dihydropteroate synthase [Streptomyces sp. NBC_00258]|nr:dihydropteroate synthase [Streptomyces sp. NBC_00258]